MSAFVSAIASVGGAVIGGISESKAASKKAKGIQAASDAQKAATDLARSELNTIFPEAQRTAQDGFQQALNVYNQALPQQANSFISGNVGAQQALLAGLPQMQNALLGNNIDLSQLQAMQVQNPYSGSALSGTQGGSIQGTGDNFTGKPSLGGVTLSSVARRPETARADARLVADKEALRNKEDLLRGEAGVSPHMLTDFFDKARFVGMDRQRAERIGNASNFDGWMDRDIAAENIKRQKEWEDLFVKRQS